jgi:hypothetical protein
MKLHHEAKVYQAISRENMQLCLTCKTKVELP